MAGDPADLEFFLNLTKRPKVLERFIVKDSNGDATLRGIVLGEEAIEGCYCYDIAIEEAMTPEGGAPQTSQLQMQHIVNSAQGAVASIALPTGPIRESERKVSNTEVYKMWDYELLQRLDSLSIAEALLHMHEGVRKTAQRIKDDEDEAIAQKRKALDWLL